MKALFKKWFRPIGRGAKNFLRPIAKKIRGPLTKLLTPPEFETAIIDLEKLTQNLKGYVDQSDQLILSMYRTLHLPAEKSPAHLAVNLGNQRILTSHPVAPFMLVNGNDLRDTPRILLGQYQPGVRKAIQQLAQPGGTFVDLCAGQGYHTLSLAVLAGRQGRVFAVETDSEAANILHDNLIATEFDGRTKIFPRDRDVAGANIWLKEQLAAEKLRPDLVRVGTSFANFSPRDGLSEWLDGESTKWILTLPAGNSLRAELHEAGYSFWIVEADGAFFRTSREEMEERGQEAEVHVLAARRLDG